jgi:hypothetical protein
MDSRFRGNDDTDLFPKQRLEADKRKNAEDTGKTQNKRKKSFVAPFFPVASLPLVRARKPAHCAFVQSAGVEKPLAGDDGSGINRFLTRPARQLTMWRHGRIGNRLFFAELPAPARLARRLLKESAVQLISICDDGATDA